MSETKCKTATTSNGVSQKPMKPFCSLAYLAKSTINSNGVSTTNTTSSKSLASTITKHLNGHHAANNCQQKQQQQQQQPASPTVASTAKVAERASPSLPTGASTGLQQHHLHSNGNAIITTSNGVHSKTDIFGEINEETPAEEFDEIDGSLHSLRPWEFSSGFVKRIPAALMTNNSHSNGSSNGHSLSSMSKMNSMDCWDYTIELECLNGPEDLQLAAELGKTLLERNKELETLLKEHKQTVEEQEQEIVYLKKHTTALREVNDSRLKIYEQLEVGIQDLERANHRLLLENTSDKKQIKTLSHNLENLETRCDDLQKQLEETRQTLSAERRKTERLMQENRCTGTETQAAARLRTTETRSRTPHDKSDDGFEANTTAPENCSFAFQSPASQRCKANSTGISGSGNEDKSFNLSMVEGAEDNEDIIKLVNDLETTKKAFMAEQQRCGELEEQLVAIIQENQSLQGRLAQTSANEEMKSMHDELSILDEVRQGQMCSRCLRAVEDRVNINHMDDDQSSMAPTEECDDDEHSLLDLDERHRDGTESINSQSGFRSSVSIKVGSRVSHSLDLEMRASPNPYRDLVDKYEALVEVQRLALVLNTSNGSMGEGMSLAEEFHQSGDFHQTQKLMLQAAAAAVTADNCAASSNGDGTSSCNGSMNNGKTGKLQRERTPTEFSEAETSSSGFSDETSNKCTQTDDRPGYFLCSIGDGEDCKFSIYDDASPIDSRFRNRPEYRELFKEIFAVLRKAAENKEEGEKLPLLDDTHPPQQAGLGAKVPPVTPANEEPPMDFGDDAQSVISSAVSEQSFAMSECITKMERKTAKKHIIEKNQENKPPSLSASMAQLAAVSPTVKEIVENGRVLTPLKREPLDYLTVGVGLKKKNRRKNRNFSNDRSESPAALPSPPRFFVSSGKKRKDMRPFVHSPMAMDQASTSSGGRPSRAAQSKCEWNGNSLVIYNRGMNSPLRGRELDMSGIEYRPSTVSQDLHKLKKLDLSYAEVLRRADACKQHYHHQHHNYYQSSPQQQQQQQGRRRQQHH